MCTVQRYNTNLGLSPKPQIGFELSTLIRVLKPKYLFKLATQISNPKIDSDPVQLFGGWKGNHWFQLFLPLFEETKGTLTEVLHGESEG